VAVAIAAANTIMFRDAILVTESAQIARGARKKSTGIDEVKGFL